MSYCRKHYEQTLCRRVLRAWYSVVRTPDISETPDDELRQFHGRTGLRNIGNTWYEYDLDMTFIMGFIIIHTHHNIIILAHQNPDVRFIRIPHSLSSYQNATLTSLSCLGVFRELVQRLPELHRVGGQASPRQWSTLAMLPSSRRPSEDIYAEAQNKPKRLNRRARQRALFSNARQTNDSNNQVQSNAVYTLMYCLSFCVFLIVGSRLKRYVFRRMQTRMFPCYCSCTTCCVYYGRVSGQE